jgi:hypothetical protein
MSSILRKNRYSYAWNLANSFMCFVICLMTSLFQNTEGRIYVSKKSDTMWKEVSVACLLR